MGTSIISYYFYMGLRIPLLFSGVIYYITPNQLSKKLGAALIVWMEERD